MQKKFFWFRYRNGTIFRYFSVYRDHLYTGFTEGLNNFGMSDKNLQFPVHGFIPNLHKDLKRILMYLMRVSYSFFELIISYFKMSFT